MSASLPSRLAAVAVAACCAGAAVPAAAARPDLSGTWTFVQKRSDDLREKIDAAVGPASTKGDIKKDSPRVWIRSWLMNVTEKPDAGILTIEQTATEFRSGTGDDVRLYSFGRPRTRQADGGVLCRATVRWEGDQVVVEERAEKGSGFVREAYTLEPGGRSIVVDWTLEHKSLRHPLVLKLVFQKQ
ncbi:MAG: hypothetical protein U0599_11285 [Vicinamibacteria bacterium]